jgi:hypothetical protein
MTTMEKHCLAYNQLILLVALVSICEFQVLKIVKCIAGSRNPLDERVVNTERGLFWLTW